MVLGDANAANAAANDRKGRPAMPDYIPQENLALTCAAHKASIKPDQNAAQLEAYIY